MQLINHSQTAVKTIAFEREETHQINLISQQLLIRGLHYDIRPLLAQHCPHYTQLSIYDPRENKFVVLPTNKLQQIARFYLEPSVILLRYRTDKTQLSNNSYEMESEEQRDSRSKQRTIGEVIQLVKRWREMHIPASRSSSKQKRMNLQEAAKEIGVSKKSLDDYYCQLRLAEHNNFDFGKKMGEKMGVLRSFVKNCKGDGEEKISRHHKHPKVLRIIDEFEVETTKPVPADIVTTLPPSEPKLKHVVSINQQAEQGQDSNNPFVRELFNLEQQFYKGFAFGFDDPVDPFLFMSDNFSRRSLQDSDNIIF